MDIVVAITLFVLALLIGVAFTTVIELIQLPEPSRISDPRDLVMNTAGAVLGVVLVQTARMVRRAGAVAASQSRTMSATTPVPVGVSHSVFPLVASYATKRPSAVPWNTRLPAVVSVPPFHGDT